VGPPVEILGVSVGPERPFPHDGVIEIAFDRYLLPSTVTRQSITIVDSANEPLPPSKAPLIVYDPVGRTVTLEGPSDGWLQEDLTYKLVLGVPAGDAELGGVRAIERATLRAEQRREFAFKVGPPAATSLPSVSFCRDVLPIFAQKCGSPSCHGSYDHAASGLVLATSEGVSFTALGRIAQGSNTGGRTRNPPAPGPRFGVDMPLIDPGNPGNSWLLYKVDVAPPPATVRPFAPPTYACSGGLREPTATFVLPRLAPGAQTYASEAERVRLSELILGRAMPFPVSSSGGYADEALTFDEREKVRLWIKRLAPGAALPECGGCGELASPPGPTP
jgi:hypothetical protein